jgi:adenosylcobinamide-GDP ribazoletransferase
VKRALSAFAGALSYFTIVPLGPLARNPAPDALVLSFLPLIGAIIGALAGAAGYGAWMLTHSLLWTTLSAWIACIALSGAIHVDGFLDCCDGLFAMAPVERRLEILRDPHHGTYALVGMTMLGAVWIGALYGFDPAHLPLVLAFSGSLARLCAMLNAWIYPYARSGAITRAFVSRPSFGIVAFGAVLVGVLAWFVQPAALSIVPCAALVSLALGWASARRLGGGLTGDVYGALVVLTEVFVLIALRACERYL